MLPLASGSTVELERALMRDPLERAHLRALYELLMGRRAWDRAYCVAATLVWLGAADREQTALFRQLRPRGGLPMFRARLHPGAWHRDLAHADLDRAVGGIFEVVARAARLIKGGKPRGQLERPDGTENLAAKALYGAAKVLGMPTPAVWIRQDQLEPVRAIPAAEPVSVLGGALGEGGSPAEWMFTFGKHLVLHQGEHAVRAAFPLIRELSTLLWAALDLVFPRSGAPSHVARLRDALKRTLSVQEIVLLETAATTFRALDYERDLEAHVTRWLHGSQRTGIRAGLLLCGDPTVAAQVLQAEPVVPGDLSISEKLAELGAFMVSEAHGALRRSLGIDVEPDGPTKAVALEDDDEPTRERALCA